MSWTQRSKTFSMCTKGLFLSNIVHKSVLICVSEHLSFAEIIHPPHRCGISRCWLDSMVIAQVCLRLATIKGHSKMCSFTGLWNVGSLLFNGCAKFLDIGRNWNTLSYMLIPNMLNGWHVRWVCWPCKNWDVFSFQELCTDPCNMRWWSWMNGTTMGLGISSRYLCAFKMPSIKCTRVRFP